MRIFSSYGDVTITGERLHASLTYTRHSWLLSSDGSLSCHTYSEMLEVSDSIYSFGAKKVEVCNKTTCKQNINLLNVSTS